MCSLNARMKDSLAVPLRAKWRKSAAVLATLSWEASLTHVQECMTMLENLARRSKKAIGKATAERHGPCSSHNNWTEMQDSLYMASIYRLTGVNFWQSAKHLSEKIEVDDRGVPTKLTALPFYFLVSHATKH